MKRKKKSEIKREILEKIPEKPMRGEKRFEEFEEGISGTESQKEAKERKKRAKVLIGTVSISLLVLLLILFITRTHYQNKSFHDLDIPPKEAYGYACVLDDNQIIYVKDNPILKLNQVLIGVRKNDEETKFLSQKIIAVKDFSFEDPKNYLYTVKTDDGTFYTDNLISNYLKYEDPQEESKKDPNPARQKYFLQKNNDNIGEILAVWTEDGFLIRLDCLKIINITKKQEEDETITQEDIPLLEETQETDALKGGSHEIEKNPEEEISEVRERRTEQSRQFEETYPPQDMTEEYIDQEMEEIPEESYRYEDNPEFFSN